MRHYRKEFNRLGSADKLVRDNFVSFGANKRQELIRLFYEISKRDNVSPHAVFRSLASTIKKVDSFNKIKISLLDKRFPLTSGIHKERRFHLPKLKLTTKDLAQLKKKAFYPKIIFYEKGTEETSLYLKFRNKFTNSDFIEILSLKEHLRSAGTLSLTDYNKRSDTVFLVNQKQDFFKSCPCTKSVKGCGYHILNLGFGCIFECTYCFLQEYTNSPGIILPVNLEDFFDGFNARKNKALRVGTGEFTDSLMIDDITGYSAGIIDFFKDKNVTFEFKTKSNNISNILKARHSGNIVVSWSLNPEIIVKKNEFLSASLGQRLDAAERCVAAGFKVGFHFDPILYFHGWRECYSVMLQKLFEKIRDKDIAWISLGTLRFNPDTKNIIERRFPDNRILDEELVYSVDEKLRYPISIRYKMYGAMLDMLRKKYKKAKIYLCMEDSAMWDSLKDFSLNTP